LQIHKTTFSMSSRKVRVYGFNFQKYLPRILKIIYFPHILPDLFRKHTICFYPDYFNHLLNVFLLLNLVFDYQIAKYSSQNDPCEKQVVLCHFHALNRYNKIWAFAISKAWPHYFTSSFPFPLCVFLSSCSGFFANLIHA
jgi:hypothetical protein